MRAVVQRVNSASVSVDGAVVGSINRGLLVLLGVAADDNFEVAQRFAERIVNLRIFPDDDGKMNLSVSDIEGDVLVVSQFTLYGDASRGRRPSFALAARPELAAPLVECFSREVESTGLKVAAGVFGAHMKVTLENDGPVTIIMEA